MTNSYYIIIIVIRKEMLIAQPLQMRLLVSPKIKKDALLSNIIQVMMNVY